jgi:hypothetical protein
MQGALGHRDEDAELKNAGADLSGEKSADNITL